MGMNKVCIVGYGAIGPIHAAAIGETESATFYAVCDNDLSRLKMCGDKYDIVSYDDFDNVVSIKIGDNETNFEYHRILVKKNTN